MRVIWIPANVPGPHPCPAARPDAVSGHGSGIQRDGSMCRLVRGAGQVGGGFPLAGRHVRDGRAQANLLVPGQRTWHGVGRADAGNHVRLPEQGSPPESRWRAPPATNAAGARRCRRGRRRAAPAAPSTRLPCGADPRPPPVRRRRPPQLPGCARRQLPCSRAATARLPPTAPPGCLRLRHIAAQIRQTAGLVASRPHAAYSAGWSSSSFC